MLLKRRPAPPLQAHVAWLWASDRPALPHVRERMLPTGRLDLVVPLLQPSIVRFAHIHDTAGRSFSGPVLQGAHDQALVRGCAGPACTVGVQFLPGGAAAIFGGAVPALRNQTVALDGLWGQAAFDLQGELREAATPQQRLRRLELALLHRLQAPRQVDAAVQAALACFHQSPALAAVAPACAASGLPAQAFIRRFEASVGLTPKRYARVLRFNALLGLLSETPVQARAGLAELALDAGYCDQSHLIREFKRLGGLTPTAYRPVNRDAPCHVPL